MSYLVPGFPAQGSCRSLLLCAGMVLWLGMGVTNTGFAQTVTDPPLRLKPTARLEADINKEQTKSAPVFVQADSLSGSTDLETIAEGDAVLRKPGMVVKGDRLEYEHATDMARAKGNVLVNRDGNRYEGPYMEVELDAFKGFFTEPRYQFLQNDANGQAKRADFIDSTHLSVHQATYTTCRRKPGPDWLPDWILKAARIDFDNDEDIGVAQSAFLYFKGVPVLGVLPISFPLSSKRKSGFLPPTVAFDTANGTEVTTPYYFDIAPNRDATLTPVYMAARGVNVGGEFRYLEPSYAGTARMSYMPADKLRSLDRWSGSLVHNGAMSTPIGGVGVALNISRVSDDDYWRDFPNATLAPGASPRLLPADVTASWGRGYFSSSVKVLKWQTLQDISAPITPPYDRVPQMTGRYARYNTAGFDWSIDGDFTQFESLSKLTGQPNAQRIFGLAQVSYPFIRPAGFITPKLQLHTRGYQYDAIHNGSQTAASTVPTFSLDSGLVFERETTLGGRGLLQTLEPRAFYVNTPYVNQSLLPNYDTGLNDFNFATIFTENAYVGNDKISDNNLLTLGLTTRYLDADSGAQLARFGVAQRLRFADQLVTGALAGFSDVLLSAGVNLNERWMLDSMLQYNGKTDELGRAVVGARYSPGNYRVINMAYRFQRNLSEQIEASGQWPLNDLWGDKGRNLGAGQGEGEGRYYAVGRVNYSLTEGRLINTVLGLEYDAGCWLGRVVLDRVQTSVSTSTSSVMFQLEFVGFTRIGLSPQKSLTTNISRYQNLRDTGSTLSRFSNYD